METLKVQHDGPLDLNWLPFTAGRSAGGPCLAEPMQRLELGAPEVLWDGYFLLSSPQPRFLHLREPKVVASPRASSVAVGWNRRRFLQQRSRPIAAALVRQVRHRLFV